MFGYAVANQEKLTTEEYEKYRAVYCGLCRRLGADRRARDKLTLNFDFVLLILTLSSVTDTPFEETQSRCAPHPVKPHACLANRFTDYAADMSVILAYYKFLDDVQDEGGAGNRAKSALFKKEAEALGRSYPEVCGAIRENLAALSAAEKRNELNPDVPANLFGRLLGAVFAGGGAEPADALYDFGLRLGRVIYLMDATVDIQADLKNEHYNPLIRTDFISCETLLTAELAECMRRFRALPIKNDRGILENILLSGIWTSYERQKREGERK